jgi:hypothetical protein
MDLKDSIKRAAVVVSILALVSISAIAQENRSEISIQGTGLFTKDTVGNGVLLTGEMRERVTKKVGNIVLAYNRRVDLTLSSTGQESARAYPFSAEGFTRFAERDPKKGPAPVQLAAEKEHMGN